MNISDEQFESIVDSAVFAIPEPYKSKVQNVAFLVQDFPNQEQRIKLNLYPNETLFGLYEGVPLPRRGGVTKLLPDIITIFKQPILDSNHSIEGVQKQVAKTVWHEVAHYFGLDHKRIHQLENKHIT